MHCRCVLDPGDKIVDCPPTFTMYEFDAAVNGALVIKGKDPLFILIYIQMFGTVISNYFNCGLWISGFNF